jgi:C-terminal processing protease CtpA/Prc
MVTYIAGFLFKNKTHLNDLYIRNTHQLNTYWTQPDTSFSQLYDMPVYILTGKTTFSAGEEFTYDLQAQKRAIVVGEATGGGAHPVGPNLAGYGFVVNIPFARAINPITKTNWEGVGVKPDMETPADKALATVLDKIKSAKTSESQ